MLAKAEADEESRVSDLQTGINSAIIPLLQKGV
jgi:hypothetical protein